MSDIASTADRGLATTVRIRSDGREAEAGRDLDFELVRSLADLDALRDEWEQLFTRAAQPTQFFQTFHWNRTWCAHFLGDAATAGAEPCILVGRRHGQTTLIWPLVVRQEFGMRIVKFMGEPVSQYGDILMEGVGDAQALNRLEAAWLHLCDSLAPDAFVLRKVRADSAIAPFLERLKSMIVERQTAPFADLSQVKDYEVFQSRFSKKFRRNCRRQLNRLKENGPITFEVHRGSANARRLATAAIEMKRRWLDDCGIVSTAMADDRTKTFFEAVAETREPSSGCRVSAMNIGGKPAAIEVGFLCKGHYFAHIGTFDLSIARLSPGTHQMAETVGHLIATGVDSYDLMAPATEYKKSWADGSIDVCDHVVAISLRGHIVTLVYWQRIRPWLKRRLSDASLLSRLAGLLRPSPRA